MKLEEFENLLVSQLQTVVENIIEDQQSLEISAKSRSGAEISDWLEEKFVQYTTQHKYFKESEACPKGKTKNPWDARTYFMIEDIYEEIWIDFKAIKISQIDSNPDIGTPTKVIQFIQSGNFYIVYIYVYYESTNNGLKFTKRNNNYSKVYLLKDISSTFRRNPKNQLQVNISQETEYRSRKEFIELLVNKLQESYHRQIDKAQKELELLETKKQKLIKANYRSEEDIINKLRRLKRRD